MIIRGELTIISLYFLSVLLFVFVIFVVILVFLECLMIFSVDIYGVRR